MATEQRLAQPLSSNSDEGGVTFFNHSYLSIDVEKSLVTQEEEKNIDTRVKAINQAQRVRIVREMLQTEEYTASEEYKRKSKTSPNLDHPKFANPPRRTKR